MKRADLHVEGDGDGVSSLGRAHHLPAEVLEIKLVCEIKGSPGQNVSCEMEWVGEGHLMA